jgi:stage V sporulation protein B
MTPTAVSQIAEQLVRVGTMIAFAYILLPYGLEYAAAGASFGAGPGAAMGLLVLIYYYWRHHRDFATHLTTQHAVRREPGILVVSRIVKLALPVSLANIMLPVVANIDLLIVPARLEAAGYTVEQATELFGYLTGMAVALVNLPTILTASLGASLVPAVSEAFTLNNHARIEGQTVTALRVANLLTIPSFVGLLLLATPISQMLYGTPNAGVPIAILSVGIVFMGLHQVTTGILQGLGHTSIPLGNMAGSAVIKVIMSWVLTAIPTLGIKGAAWATVTDFGIAAFLNLIFVHRYVGASINWRELAKTGVAAVMMGAVVLIVYDYVMAGWLSNTLATSTAIVVGIIIYSLVLLLLGGVQQRDFERVPRVGQILVKLLKTIGLMRR